MNPKVFEILNASVDAKEVLGQPLRVYPWDRAPEKPMKPYVTYGIYNGNPENFLDRVPDIDNKGTQVNIFSNDPNECEAVATIVRNQLEPFAHMTSFSGPERDPATNDYSFRLEFDFWEDR